MRSSRGKALSIGGPIALVVLLAAALWFTNRPGPALAKVGDCVSAPKSGKFTKVGCTDSDAAFQVIGSYPGHDSNQCDRTPATQIAVLATSGTKESILCLGPRK
jgi:hypothetical protein